MEIFKNLSAYQDYLQDNFNEAVGTIQTNFNDIAKFVENQLNELIKELGSDLDGAHKWVKSFIYGEFNTDPRPVSVVATEMLAGFVPGTVLVFSARDAVAISLRILNDPSKQDDVQEWMLLAVYVLPFVLIGTSAATGVAAGAAGGAVVGGAGAAPGAGLGGLVGGAIGSTLGNVVKCVGLFLIQKTPHLATIVSKLNGFMKGNVLATLQKIKYSDYTKSVTNIVTSLLNQLLGIVKRVKAVLSYGAKVNWMGLGWAKSIYLRMEKFEVALTSMIQKSAIKIRQGFKTFDEHLQDLLKQSVKLEPAYATVGTKVKPVPAPAQTVKPSFPETAKANVIHSGGATASASRTPENVHQPKVKEPITKLSKKSKTACIKPVATKKALEEAKMLIDLDYPPGSKGKSPEQYIYDETKRQLDLQNQGLAKMSVESYLLNRQNYDDKKMSTGSGRGTSAPQNAARVSFENKIYDDYFKKYRKEGKKIDQAKALASQAKEKIMSTQAALHNPDQKIGGNNSIDSGNGGMGNKSVNGSIGGQWKGGYVDDDTKKSTTRVKELDRVAESVPVSERSKTGVNADLRVCEKNGV